MPNPRNLLTALSQYGRRKRRSAGRVVMSAAGFSAAYYFDPMNGEQRRRRLQAFVRRTGDTIDEVFSGDGSNARSEHRAVGSIRLSSANGASVR